MQAADIVARMIRGWEALDVDAIAACLAADAVWHNIPYPPIAGRETVAAAIGRFLQDMASCEFRVHRSGEIAPDVVVNERTDMFRRKDGRALNIPVMGCFEIRDGLIVSWRDYFDRAAMA